MREILFRGKREDTGKWVEGSLVIFGDDYYIINSKISLRSVNFSVDERNGYFTDIKYSCKIVPETIGQYTNLTDRNDNKIFEGDIIKGYNGFGKIIAEIIAGTVTYNEDLAVFAVDDYPLGGMSDLEIVGNIYNDPESLEVE